MNSVASPSASPAWSGLLSRQRALGVAILAGLLAFAFDAWGDAVERGGDYETGDLTALHVLEGAAAAVAAVALAFYAICLVATRSSDAR